MSGRVPPSSRAGQRVKQFARTRDTRRAIDIYERFTGHDGEVIGTLKIPDLPKTVAVIGPCDGIMYSTRRDGRAEKYIHEFAAGDRPLLCVSPDSKTLYLVGGAFEFTERGIVDHSDVKNRRRR